MKQEDEPVRDEHTHRILGAAFEVHSLLGCGFLEQVYQDALTIEFLERDIDFVREVPLRVSFKGRTLSSFYRPDFLCFGAVVVEAKATKQITVVDLAQMINYLKIARCDRGMILNFGGRSLEFRRVIASCSVPVIPRLASSE